MDIKSFLKGLFQKTVKEVHVHLHDPMNIVGDFVVKMEEGCEDLTPTIRGTAGRTRYILYASEDVVIPHGQLRFVGTGVKYKIPDGYILCAVPIEPFGADDFLAISNQLIMTEPDLDSVIRLGIFNFSSDRYKICRGDKIAYVVIAKLPRTELIVQPINEGVTNP